MVFFIAGRHKETYSVGTVVALAAWCSTSESHTRAQSNSQKPLPSKPTVKKIKRSIICKVFFQGWISWRNLFYSFLIYLCVRLLKSGSTRCQELCRFHRKSNGSSNFLVLFTVSWWFSLLLHECKTAPNLGAFEAEPFYYKRTLKDILVKNSVHLPPSIALHGGYL